MMKGSVVSSFAPIFIMVVMIVVFILIAIKIFGIG